MKQSNSLILMNWNGDQIIRSGHDIVTNQVFICRPKTEQRLVCRHMPPAGRSRHGGQQLRKHSYRRSDRQPETAVPGTAAHPRVKLCTSSLCSNVNVTTFELAEMFKLQLPRRRKADRYNERRWKDLQRPSIIWKVWIKWGSRKITLRETKRIPSTRNKLWKICA